VALDRECKKITKGKDREYEHHYATISRYILNQDRDRVSNPSGCNSLECLILDRD